MSWSPTERNGNKMKSIILETRNLSKRFNTEQILKNINISIQPGEIYGLIGKNGAGKTTLMRILAGSLSAFEGTFQYAGEEKANKPSRFCSALIDGTACYPELSAIDNMRVYSAITNTDGDQTIDGLLNKVGLNPKLKKRVGAYSLGMRNRLGIAMALYGNPQFIILDEPMNGLDPTGMKHISELLIEESRKGTGILISSHILSQLSQTASRFGFMKEGMIVKELPKTDMQDLGENLDQLYSEYVEGEK